MSSLQRLLDLHLPAGERLYRAPTIPAAVQQAARAAYEIPDELPLLAVFDDTPLGGGAEGFIITPRYLAFRGAGERPVVVAWIELEPGTFRFQSGVVTLPAGRVGLTQAASHGPALCAFLNAVAQDRGSRVLEGPLQDESVIAWARRRLPAEADFYFGKAIPTRKLKGAAGVHAEWFGGTGSRAAVVLYDDTVFGSAKDGFLMSAERLCVRNYLEDPWSVAWAHLDPATVREEGDRVYVGDAYIKLTAKKEHSAALARLIVELARAAQGWVVYADGSAPPPEPAPPAREVLPGYLRCPYCSVIHKMEDSRCTACGAPL